VRVAAASTSSGTEARTNLRISRSRSRDRRLVARCEGVPGHADSLGGTIDGEPRRGIDHHTELARRLAADEPLTILTRGSG
jgi:hypothetical protein